MEQREPTNERAELAVLGAMINDEQARYEIIADLDADHFTSDDRRNLYEHIGYMTDGRYIDLAMVENSTKDNRIKHMARMVDGHYIDKEHYRQDMQQVQTAQKERQLHRMLHKGLHQLNVGSDVETISNGITNSLSHLIGIRDDKSILMPKPTAEKLLASYRERRKNPDAAYGLRYSTQALGQTVGFPTMDENTLGGRPGDLVMLGAETGVGKTALGINIMRNFSIFQDHVGYYLNTEMQEDEMGQRLISPIAGVSVKEIMSARLEGSSETQLEKDGRIEAAAQKFHESNAIISELPGLTVPQIRGLAKQIQLQHGKLDYLIIDYIQRLTDVHPTPRKEYEFLKDAAKQIKEIAREFQIPIYIMAQRNFEGYIEGAKAMKNECDVVYYIEPLTSDDNDLIRQKYHDDKLAQKVNYKITKEKVRRDSDRYPIYVSFDKKHQFINEVVQGG